jgi:NAD(P)-dependent dehydrogenase (short-subunit alcohol dehydrogenase family)
MMLETGYEVLSLDVTAPVSGDLAHVHMDVRDSRSVEGAMQSAVSQLGGLDVLVNSAGISSVGAVESNSDEEWLASMDVNVIGVARVTRSALPHLREGDSPVVVNLASVASHMGIPNRVIYSATKGAVLAMTLAMATDYLAEGIRVNAVAPGTVDTPWVARLLDKADDPVAARRALEARQPIGRLVTAQEVALAICYLADPRAGSATGTVLDVDGGMHRLVPAR